MLAGHTLYLSLRQTCLISVPPSESASSSAAANLGSSCAALSLSSWPRGRVKMGLHLPFSQMNNLVRRRRLERKWGQMTCFFHRVAAPNQSVKTSESFNAMAKKRLRELAVKNGATLTCSTCLIKIDVWVAGSEVAHCQRPPPRTVRSQVRVPTLRHSSNAVPKG